VWKREHYADGERSWVDNLGGAVPASPDTVEA
jgi:molybdopterin synthase catalytic subunit